MMRKGGGQRLVGPGGKDGAARSVPTWHQTGSVAGVPSRKGEGGRVGSDTCVFPLEVPHIKARTYALVDHSIVSRLKTPTGWGDWKGVGVGFVWRCLPLRGGSRGYSNLQRRGDRQTAWVDVARGRTFTSGWGGFSQSSKDHLGSTSCVVSRRPQHQTTF
eukprot:760257-Hanusia_phi.AAC.1